ncbi:MAG: NUDIX domain-containing protein [Phycisphaerae bacterium]|nr:NUDIX domain-containing protein [Phycisphaerae bacterium]
MTRGTREGVRTTLRAMSAAVTGSDPSLPYRIATLCDLRDARGRILLLRRLREPNKGLCSPIGGKLDVASGESPAQCARREILEEAGLDIPIERLHLLGMISEAAYEGRGHWLLFLYRVMGPVWIEPHDMEEGRLEWFEEGELDLLPLPTTDRQIIWPLVRSVEAPAPGGRPGYFSVHVDCRGESMRWSVEAREPGVAGA